MTEPGKKFLSRAFDAMMREMHFLKSLGFWLEEGIVSADAWVHFRRGNRQVVVSQSRYSLPVSSIAWVIPAKYSRKEFKLPDELVTSKAAQQFAIDRKNSKAAEFFGKLDEGSYDELMQKAISWLAKQVRSAVDAESTIPPDQQIANSKLLSFEHVYRLKAYDGLLRLDKQLSNGATQPRKDSDIPINSYTVLVALYLFEPIKAAMQGDCDGRLRGARRTAVLDHSTVAALYTSSRICEIMAEFAGLRSTPSALEQRRIIARAVTGAQAALSVACPTFVVKSGGKPAELNCKDSNAKKEAISWAKLFVDSNLAAALPQIFAVVASHSIGDASHWRCFSRFRVFPSLDANKDIATSVNTAADSTSIPVFEADCCYAITATAANADFFNAIHAVGSAYVSGIRRGWKIEALSSRRITTAARKCNVVSDEIVLMSVSSRNCNSPNHSTRLVKVAFPSPRKDGEQGVRMPSAKQEFTLIVTNLLDVPSEIIAILHLFRSTVEFAVDLRSYMTGQSSVLKRQIDNATYCSLLACMIISVLTRKRPSKATVEVAHDFLTGWTSLEEVITHIELLESI